MQRKWKLYVDMDGVLAKFYKSREPDMKDLYVENRFLSLDVQKRVVDAIRLIMEKHPEVEVFVLSAYPEDSRYALPEKKRWLGENLPEIDSAHQIFCSCADKKSDFVTGGVSSRTALLDDYNPNLEEWEASGGVSIKLLNNINDSSKSWKGRKINYARNPRTMSDVIVRAVKGEMIQDRNPSKDDEFYQCDEEDVPPDIQAYER